MEKFVRTSVGSLEHDMAKVTRRTAIEGDPIYSEGFIISTRDRTPEPDQSEKRPKKTDGIPELAVPDDLLNMDVNPADGFRLTAAKRRREK